MPALELLAPAGSSEALDAAVACGADAVYLGLKSFNARMRSANFSFSQFEAALRSLHRMGRRVYVTLNTVFEQREADRMYQLLKYLASTGPDGIIVQDFGVLTLAREFPGLRLHASTQMNIAGARGANALSRRGVSRVVLARELSLEEIQAVRQNTNLELEVFVHGALCVSESGLCLFSSYLGGKSANRGMCTQACRRLYQAEGPGQQPAPDFASTAHSAGEAASLQSGYFFSPCDLSLIGRIGELAAAGVSSFKIEGRMKSAEYVGAVVSAYRLIIDNLDAGEDAQRRALEDARRILNNDFARPKTEFFFENARAHAGTFLRPDEAGGTGIALGPLLETSGEDQTRRGTVACKAALSAGDSIRLHRADDSHRQTHKLVFAEPAGHDRYRISIPGGFHRGDAVYLIQTRAMTKRYPQIIPKDLSPFRKRPGRDTAPAIQETARGTEKTGRAARPAPLPEGIYAAAASVEDLYVFQSIRPAAAILPLSRKTAPRLLDSQKPLPFRPAELILTLGPYFPQNADALYTETIPALLEKGYRTFILNNPGYFSLFRGAAAGNSGSVLIAGPWLYTFNAYAAAFTAELGADYTITPLENNRQNLEKTWSGRARSHVLVSLFAWPPLFRIRTDLSAVYPFKQFSDGRGAAFSLVAGGSRQDGETLVVPEQPFSIIDKKPFLLAAGFRRFILDFSGAASPLKKTLYRELMKAVETARPLNGAVRFNWKDGFFHNEE